MIKQAIILAAGGGTRLRPLTNNCPKPMLTINGKPLLVYQLEALVQAGIIDVVIHVAYLADKIINTIKDGRQYGLNMNITYATIDEPLETGGGLAFCLAKLPKQDEPFICINGKIFTDYNYSNLADINLGENMAHMILVPNPPENLEGDYNLTDHNYLVKKSVDHYHNFTFSGIAVYDAKLLREQLASITEQKFSIIKIINNNLDRVSGSVYNGIWYGLETVEQYNSLNQQYSIISEHL